MHLFVDGDAKAYATKTTSTAVGDSRPMTLYPMVDCFDSLLHIKIYAGEVLDAFLLCAKANIILVVEGKQAAPQSPAAISW